MAWTETTRARYERHSGRYASDLTDQEWGLIAPFLPPPKTTGRPRSTAMRDVLDAILYIASAGCASRPPAPSPAILRPARGRSARKPGPVGGHKRQKTPKKFKKTRSVFLVLSVL